MIYPQHLSPAPLLQPEDEIHRGAKEGRVGEIRDLLLNDFTRYTLLNSRDSRGRSPLHHAVRKGHLDVVKAILAAGAALDLADSKGRTPLQLAARAQNEFILHLLLFGTAQITAPPSSSSSSSAHVQEALGEAFNQGTCSRVGKS